MIEALRGQRNDASPEQLTRMLDALREGESLVRLGLSEKANFEVTLFRAVEAGRTRSIDQVIRQISKVIPEDSKKKSLILDKKAAQSSRIQDSASIDVSKEITDEKQTLKFLTIQRTAR